MGLVIALYVARIVFVCFPHVVDVSALSICIVLRAYVVVISMCLLCVSFIFKQNRRRQTPNKW